MYRSCKKFCLCIEMSLLEQGRQIGQEIQIKINVSWSELRVFFLGPYTRVQAVVSELTCRRTPHTLTPHWTPLYKEVKTYNIFSIVACSCTEHDRMRATCTWKNWGKTPVRIAGWAKSSNPGPAARATRALPSELPLVLIWAQSLQSWQEPLTFRAPTVWHAFLNNWFHFVWSKIRCCPSFVLYCPTLFSCRV